MIERLTDVWFEFKNQRNTDYNVKIVAMPQRTHPAERGEQITVPGRSDELWAPERADRTTYDPYTISIRVAVDDVSNIDTVNAWLSGSGEFRMSDEPNRVYKARIIKQFVRTNKFTRFTLQEFTVVFNVEPFRYAYMSSEDAADITVTASGTVVTNPGTADADPRITIEGTGDVVLYISTQQVDIDGLTDGIVIDSALMDCFNLAMDDLANDKVVMDDFPMLKPGDNLISWEGDVTSVTIRPRWRWI